MRKTFFPYCLDRLSDGRYIVLNRKYKPLGVSDDAWVEYENHPTAVKLNLTKSIISKLSVKPDPDEDRIYLYNDATNPTLSKENWDAYAKRLETLAKLTVSQ